MTNRRNLLVGGALLSCLGATRAFSQAAPLVDVVLGTQAAAGVPALAGMIVGPDGPTWTGATGLRRKDGDAPVTVEDKWHLGSNTKAMTAALFGRFVDQGRARWGARVVDLLQLDTTAPEWADVTIEAVLAHSAGLLDQTAMGMPWLMAARDDPRPLAEQRRSLAQAMLAAPPAGPAGTFAYANSNYVLIGAIIEQIAGAPWETVMASDLFEPLGVTSGGFGAPRGEQPWGHRAGLAIDPTSPGSDNPLAMGPAGTVHMTLADYARFWRVLRPTAAGG